MYVKIYIYIISYNHKHKKYKNIYRYTHRLSYYFASIAIANAAETWLSTRISFSFFLFFNSFFLKSPSSHSYIQLRLPSPFRVSTLYSSKSSWYNRFLQEARLSNIIPQFLYNLNDSIRIFVLELLHQFINNLLCQTRHSGVIIINI